ncbi:damaged DNA binding [Ascochyta rabiei]|uniref:Damaged DNA binding n=1 Tax=Didymella rabiei TaxID=5454 RepID=A0A163AIV2_DIDRA|nr:damaged DNA binding [Ascochyta rabiei]
MPEIAEVARVVHYLKKHLVGRTIASVRAEEDDLLFGKVGTSASAFKTAMTGKKILDARQQGKYFWLIMDSKPHPLMHLGMTGWIKFSHDDTSAYYKPKKEETDWPPRYWKFVLSLKGKPECEVAFVDPRRLGRCRLINAEAEDMRKTSPLKENGPDPVIDKDVLTVEWLTQLLRRKKVPVKALLLDQANISGIGNWVADETMYQARLHPEQYSNTFSDEQIKRLHDAIMYVCDTAVGTLAESDKFPKDWLMKYRWDKGKKTGGKLPNGAKITFLTVGGRTSAVVPSVQKKTAAVAGDVSESADDKSGESEVEVKPKKSATKKKDIENAEENQQAKAATAADRPKREREKVDYEIKNESEEGEDEAPVPKRQKTSSKAPPKKAKAVREESDESPEEEIEVKEAPTASKAKKTAGTSAKKAESTEAKEVVKSEETNGRRRSGRTAK